MQRVHCLANIKTALEFLESKNIEEQEEILLEILGLPAGSGRSRGSAKHILKQWVQEIFNGFFWSLCRKYEVKVNDFGPSWRDGIAFNAMVHNIDSRLVRMEDLKQRSHRENLEHAFSQAEAHLGIPRLLDPEDVDVDRPDEKSIMTYVAQFFKAYPDGGKRKTVEEAPDSTSLIDESANARELIAAIRKTEAEVSTEMNRKNVSLSEQFQLEADWEQASTNNSNTSSDLEIATEALASLRDTLDTWRWKLDSMVPGDLGKIARWICQAEQWLKATSRSWYQSVTGSKLIAVTGRHDESWRPSSADPPNSPPSSLKVVQLIEEKKEVFGLNNARATTMRDLLSSTQTQTDSQLEFVPKFLVEQLGKRIADVIGREPGCTAVLEAARARRKFLDLLYADNIVETEKGVTIRNRRKTSTVGLEHRLVDWTVAVDGLQSSENKQTIEQMLIDYEWIKEAQSVALQLGASGDHELIQSLKKRLAGLNEQVGNLKAAEANKLENARREEQAQAEFELVQYLDKVEEWTSTVDRFLNPASKQGTEEERIMCTSRELDKLMDRLNELITMQSKAQENLQIAIRIANSPPLQPGESKSQARLSHVEVQMEHLYPTLTSQVANLKDLVEKTQHIESGLAQIERAVKQVEMWHGKLFSSVSPEGVANNSNIFAEVSLNSV
ncbi:Nesprin-1 [Fasciola hepatica]|uniref:Nesprin-1 n=1 Tax=Fasciola hepatica TaxID=6192 RepID=A0A4E0RIN2_FASHE|nr:Nesprin-1 [Fasciola hepatica]